jgi:hypothetical protein
VTFLWPEKLRNGQERWALRKFGHLRTVRDVERSETFILYKINGLKRLQNHVHASKSKETLIHLLLDKIKIALKKFKNTPQK